MVCCLLFVVLVGVVWCLLFDVRDLLFVVCLLAAVRCALLWFVVCCLVFAIDRCLLFVGGVGGVLFGVCCLMFAMC